MVRLCLFLLAASPFMATAGQLHRCVSAAGTVSYQSNSCGTGQRLDRVIAYVPEADSRPLRVLQADHDGRRRYRSPNARGNDVRSTAAKRAPDACGQARRQRSASLEKLGLRRTFDDLSRLDAAVRTACKGY